MSSDPAERRREYGRLVKDTRERLGWSQDELADKAGVGRATVQRHEGGKSPDPDAVRKIFKALHLDPREAPVILGFVTREEMGLPPEPQRVFPPTIEEVIDILQDPKVSDVEKAEWITYLKWRTRGRESG